MLLAASGMHTSRHLQLKHVCLFYGDILGALILQGHKANRPTGICNTFVGGISIAGVFKHNRLPPEPTFEAS